MNLNAGPLFTAEHHFEMPKKKKKAFYPSMLQTYISQVCYTGKYT